MKTFEKNTVEVWTLIPAIFFLTLILVGCNYFSLAYGLTMNLIFASIIGLCYVGEYALKRCK
jgi:hypothetical protein